MPTSVRTALFLALLAPVALAARAADDEASITRGLYVTKIAACNDCHTAGYRRSSGDTPQSEWLRGTSLGEQGPWGTTYPTNLRLYMAALTEDQWVGIARSLRARPPMPWFNIQFMTEADQRSIYRFIRSLDGPLGDPAPDYVPPGVMPKTPYVITTPQQPH